MGIRVRQYAACTGRGPLAPRTFGRTGCTRRAVCLGRGSCRPDTARHPLPASARYAHESAGHASCAAALPAVRAHALVHGPAALHATALGVRPHDAAAGVLRQLGRELERRGAISVRGATRAGHDAHGGRFLSVRLPSRLQVLRRPHTLAAQPQPSRTVWPGLLHVCRCPLPDCLPTRRQHLMKDVIRRTQGRDQAPICMHYVMRSPIPSRVTMRRRWATGTRTGSGFALPSGANGSFVSLRCEIKL